MKNKALLLPTLLLAFVACATTDDADDGVTDEAVTTAAAATSEGTVDGKPVKLNEGAADALVRLKSGKKIGAASSQIELSSGRNTCTEHKKGAQQVRIRFTNHEGDIEPGSVFEIAENDEQALTSSAQYWLSDDDCGFVGEISATRGHVKITKATSQRILGEYEYTFGKHGTIKGTFDAPTCIKTRDYSPKATFVCAE